MGVGTYLSRRNQFCNRHNPLNHPWSKKKLVKLISEFNHQSLPFFGFGTHHSYYDNYSEINASNELFEHDFYFYSTLELIKDNQLHTVLHFMDTSDFSDQGFFHMPRYSGIYVDGMMSENQIFLASKESMIPKNRIFVSHFPFEDIKNKQDVIEHINDYFTMKNVSNHWLSAHSHRQEPKIEKLTLGDNKFLTHFNIGSSTDYRPHVAIYHSYNKKNLEEGMHYETIFLKNDKKCSKHLTKMLMFPNLNNPIIPKKERFEILYGIGLQYKKKKLYQWTPKSSRIAINNIQTYLESFDKNEQDLIIRCLFLAGSQNESNDSGIVE